MKEILNKLKKLSQKTNNKNFFNWLYFFLLIILVFNIYFSQNISPLFFGLINYNKSTTVQFLQKIRSTPDFFPQLKYFEEIFGSSLKNDVFAKEKQRELKIKQLEQILKKNYQARDILYSLYLLNLEKGNRTAAEKYLQVAKQVDPNIK